MQRALAEAECERGRERTNRGPRGRSSASWGVPRGVANSFASMGLLALRGPNEWEFPVPGGSASSSSLRAVRRKRDAAVYVEAMRDEVWFGDGDLSTGPDGRAVGRAPRAPELERPRAALASAAAPPPPACRASARSNQRESRIGGWRASLRETENGSERVRCGRVEGALRCLCCRASPGTTSARAGFAGSVRRICRTMNAPRRVLSRRRQAREEDSK
jgi:hypothetical protein